MSSEHDEAHVFRLSNEHYEWSDNEDLVPAEPTVREELKPLYLTGDQVGDVDSLHIQAHGRAPVFSEDDLALKATSQEVAQWRAAYADVEQAQQALRDRLKTAQAAYEAEAGAALAELDKATALWRPVAAELERRSAELAAELQAHREAAKEWKAAQDAKEQEHLDLIEGPRALVLYKPASLGSARQTDHIARVHLVDCKRRKPQLGESSPYPATDPMLDNVGLRAKDAWYRLNHVSKWLPTAFAAQQGDLRVKFCNFCKPWTVFQEHIDDFPRPVFARPQQPMLGAIQLTDIPTAWNVRPHGVPTTKEQ
ncbi:hypothetical protein [Streptomyces sp. cg35]|uniref:hypothetical protein n=1 Tax=Streptomyces sp. cg35 TaxID=3421650 RepID=UPI003D17ADF9